jgi:hypothetical protein
LKRAVLIAEMLDALLANQNVGKIVRYRNAFHDVGPLAGQPMHLEVFGKQIVSVHHGARFL